MKSLILYIIIGAIVGASAIGEGAAGAIAGAIGGIAFWIFIKFVNFTNRNTEKIASLIDDD